MKLSTLIDRLQKELDERGDAIVAIQSEASPKRLVTERLDTVPVTNKHTGRKRLIIVSDPEWRTPDDEKEAK
nr:MAG TPA: hypothetical protein [Caudoviricetes sp.]